MKKIIKMIPTGLAFAPLAAMAAYGGAESGGVRWIIDEFRDVLTSLVPVLITLALVVFIWGVIQYIIAGDDEEKRKKSKDVILYGIIGLFVIVAVWGLVNLVGATFGIRPGGTIEIPQFEGSGYRGF